MIYLLIFTIEDNHLDFGWFDTEDEMKSFIEYYKKLYFYQFQIHKAMHIKDFDILERYIEVE